MTRGYSYNYWRMTFDEITGEEKWFKSEKMKKARVINWISKSDSWFPAISADLLVACSTTQHCLVIAQCNCHTVLNITTVKLPHSAVCAACHTQQSFVTNRSTPPSAATALYQAAVSHWFPCFRTTFPTDFIFSIFSDPTFHRFPRWASSRARGRWTSQAPPRRVKLQQRWVTWLCLDRKTNPRRPSFDRRTNLAPLFVLDFHMGMTWWNVLVL